MTATRERAWLTRNVRVTSGVSFLQDAASELLYPVLPIFLTAVLGAPAAVVGLVEGLAEGVAAVTKVVSGRVSDRYPRRPLVGLGYGLAAVGKALVAVATSWPVVLAGRSVDRFGKGVRGAPRDALIAADVAPEQRGKAFGFHRAADTAGAVVGPLVGLAAYELLDHRIRPLLVIAVVPAVLSALLVLALREPPRAPAASSTARARPAFRPSQLPDRYWRVVAVLGVFSLVNFPDALLLLRLSEIGFGVAAVVLAYVGYNLVYAALSYPAGALADRMPRHRVVAVGLLAFALAYVGLGATRSHLAAWLLLAVYGTFTAFTDGVGKAWVSSLVGERDQGTAQGTFQGVTGAGVLVAGVWAGLAWGADGSLPLVVAGVAALAVAVGLLAAPLLLRRHPGALAR